MKTRAGLLLTCATGALLIGGGLINQARAADFPVKAVPPVDLGWWFHGDAEVGGRFFTHQQGGSTGCNVQTSPPGWTGLNSNFRCFPASSLGKFYEYRDLRPGPFGNLTMAAGSNDGLWGIGFWARNIGYNDQSYFLDVSKAGEAYLSIGWDELRHVYNDNASTIFGGVGGNALTVDPALRALLNAQNTVTGGPANPVPGPSTNAQRTNVANAIENNLQSFNLGFQRNTGMVDGRWTPTDNWDVKADYTRTTRDGTQPMGALTFQLAPGFSASSERSGRVPLELPKPINDTTDNVNGSVEYNGATPWGKKFNVSAGYGFSSYRNQNSAIYFQNPFVTVNDALNPLWNAISLTPDNTASMFRMNGGIELPWNSRYTTAVQYSIGQQNQAFMPFTVNPAVTAANACVPGGAPPGKPSPVSASCSLLAAGFPTISQSSLNGESDTLLVNNVLTTTITSDLKSTVRYRYYDYANNTPVTSINSWIYADTAAAAEDTRIAQGTAYIKQNASADLTYNPMRWLSLGAGAAWERWDRDHRDANVTDEWTAKVFADAKPWDWAKIRTSFAHSERRYDSYDATMVESNNSAGGSTYRLFDMANRTRDKGNFYVDFELPQNVTLTPTAGFRWDNYGTDPYSLSAVDITGTPRGENGLLRDHAINYGVELAWSPSRAVNFIASYTRENSNREIMANSNTAMLDVAVADKIDTYLLGTNIVIVPEKLDVKASATYTRANAAFGQVGGGIAPFIGNTGSTSVGDGTQFNMNALPDQQISFIRFDVQTRYRFDPTFVQMLGLKGEVYAKLRYIYEHNTVSDWAAVDQNYLLLIGGSAAPYSKGVFMGWNDPNYNVQMLMASLGFKW